MPIRDLLSNFVWSLISAKAAAASAAEASRLRAIESVDIARSCREKEIDYRDPLAAYLERSDEIREILSKAANHVGDGVMVGRCTIWGGRSSTVAGLYLGDGVRIYDGCRIVIDHLAPESGVKIEEKAALNFNCYIEGAGGVIVKRRAIFGPNVVVLSSSHGVEPESRDAKRLSGVVIGESVWIGANSVILPGVEIGDRTVIAAGSVVRESMPPDVLAAGAPARIIRKLTKSADSQIEK